MAGLSASLLASTVPLDTALGMERLMGDRRIYLQILKRFRHDYAAAVQDALIQLEGGDVETARRTIHTLKGAAGLIGGQEVYALAQEADAVIARGEGAALRRLDHALIRLLAMIDGELLESPVLPDTMPPPMPAQAELDALLRRLAQMLDEGNGEAIDVLEQHASVLAAALGVNVYETVSAAAHEFDFEGALAALKPLLQNA
ncbi:Hpt domain-containing protein [Massilia endophytica]|uniref:Hpt domain-containing protein n=1 Tax=Massilia endophytica TaxID=2899220 RepID=UPI001E556CF6|nr:Hpt domain-containing protein [Massilia endophytica]UGQ46663.1 Hpt domain-containing protein [Massilia endophytica]